MCLATHRTRDALRVVPKEHGWACMLNANLGEALGPRERALNGIWKRSFTNGVVYVDEPGNLTQTIAVAPGLQNIQGESVSTLTLAGDSGAVLIK